MPARVLRSGAFVVCIDRKAIMGAPASLQTMQSIGDTWATGAVCRVAAYSVHVVLFCLAAAAIYMPLADGAPLLWVNPEFVFYRVGDALAIESGELEQVHPIQGLPNAIVSKY